MRPGVGWILAGFGLLGAGIAVTVVSKAVFWYGGIVVGILWIVRGIIRLTQAPPQG